MHAKNPEDLTEWICLSDRFSQLGLSIMSGIVGLSKRPTGLVCPFRLALWKKESFNFKIYYFMMSINKIFIQFY